MAAAILFLLASIGSAQAANAIDLGYRQMYDLDFAGAHRTFNEWNAAHPSDPLGYVSDAAAYLFAEFDRMRLLQSAFFTHNDSFSSTKALTPDPAAKDAFLKEIGTGERLAKAALDKPGEHDLNARFAWVLSFGLRADYDGLIEKRYLTSVSYMKTGRIEAEKLLAMDPNCHDAYVAMGVEAYVLGSKPMPVRWMLRLMGSNTDIDDGIRKVRLAADGGRYLQPFARLLLAVAALRSNDVHTATNILEDLSKEFPHNRLYAEELARLKKTK
ncbi:MAG TPA: hypothetical protein VGL53_04510 [Bryobacteraceae bacterium]